MKAPVARGFRTLRRDAVQLSDWQLVVENETIAPMPDDVANWTMFTSMSIAVDVTLDLSSAIAHLGLHPTSQVAAVLRWRSDTTYVSGASTPVRLRTGTTSVKVEIEGQRAGGRLILAVEVILLEPGLPTDEPNAPRDRAAILWRDSRALRVEGDAPQMPIVSVSFKERFPSAANAIWHVELHEQSLETPASAAFIVWLNSDHPAVRAVTDGDDDESRGNLLTLIGAAVGHRLVEHAITSYDPDELEAAHAQFSFGEFLRNLMLLIAPSVADTRELYESDRALFEARVQSQVGALL